MAEKDHRIILLVDLAKDRNQHAFRELLEPLRKGIMRRFYGHPGLDPEDLFQETSINVYRKLDQFKPTKGSFSTWVSTIAQNVFRNALRDLYRRGNYILIGDDFDEIIEESQDLSQTPDEKIEHDERKDAVHDTIQSLPQDLQDALRLYEFGGLSYKEIGEYLQVPITTVKNRIFRAKKRFKEIFEKRHKNLLGD